MRRGLCLLGLLLFATGCMLPAKGTPVHVDMRAGSYWGGNGVLLEVSEDEQQCRVATRGASFLVRERWVHCDFVHPKHSRDHF